MNVAFQWRRRVRFIQLWCGSGLVVWGGSVLGLGYLSLKSRVSVERADFTLLVLAATIALATLINVVRNWKCPACEHPPIPYQELFLSLLIPRPGVCGGCRQSLK